MPPHIIMHGIPDCIIVMRSFIISICDASIGMTFIIMPSFVISQLILHIIGIIMPMPIMCIMGFIIPIICIIGFIIIGIIGIIIGMGDCMPIIGFMPVIIGFIPFIIGFIMGCMGASYAARPVRQATAG